MNPSLKADSPHDRGTILFWRFVGIYFGIAQYQEAADCENWPKIAAEVYDVRFYDSQFQGKQVFSVYVLYRYTIDGKTYAGGENSAYGNNISAIDKDLVLATYPRGSHPVIYVSPSNPGYSLLEPTVPPLAYIMLIAPFLLPVLAIVLVSLQQKPPAGATVSTPRGAAWLKKTGGSMVGVCIMCRVVGRGIVARNFPDARGQGLTPGVLLILIPIWSIGILGLVACIAGFVWGSLGRKIVLNADEQVVQ